MQWANDTFNLREITKEGNPAVCTPWVPIHLSFNRSAGAASLCLSEHNQSYLAETEREYSPVYSIGDRAAQYSTDPSPSNYVPADSYLMTT